MNNGAFTSRSWVSALLATAATYFYFLIFAEFAFLKLAASVVPDAAGLRGVMLALGAGGVGGALLATRADENRRARALAWGFIACAVSAFAAATADRLWLLLGSSVAVGLSLGWVTVSLAAILRRSTGDHQLGVCIGAGTGLAYAACNVPAVFHAAPGTQTLAAGVAAIAAAFLPIENPSATPLAAAPRIEYDRPSLGRWALILMALVWIDSAAFYIIQHTAPLRAATWHEPRQLWVNAVMHLIVAIGAGYLLDRGRRAILVLAAGVTLSLAVLVLDGALPAVLRPGWLYTAGVSAYSTLLVEYPARSGRASVAAWVFATAGWLGSAMGIGMAQDLNHVPPSFVLAAATLLLIVLASRARALRRAATVAVLVAGVSASPLRAGEGELIARGREVYIAEGCIHCHSQYVRRTAPQDVQLWGPATVLPEALAASPPLFGTRRQGPDLSHVGNRRSAEWNRLHLISPQDVSPGSRMPSYAHLFRGTGADGEALVAYLASLGRESMPERRAQIDAWSPNQSHATELRRSRQLFLQLCAHCHGPRGRGDGPMAARLSLRPPDWEEPTWRRVLPATDVETALCRIIKFGLPGTPMAGHEYLPDPDIVGLARFVQSLHGVPGAGASAGHRP